MYLRTTTIRQNGKTYRYAQLVQSYRRKDGTPTNRIIKSLGRLTDQEIKAVRAALKIAREGGTPVVAEETLKKVKLQRSLRYLDAAVLLRAWYGFSLHTLLADAMGSSRRGEIDPVEVTAALVLNRCIAPTSKLASTEWYPTTALPELQGIAPDKFNNNRLHRVLSLLHESESRLQDKLPIHLEGKRGPATALFVDATDTWFEGHGPPMASKAVDKVGVFRRRVGIVLLCDSQGLPLRWHTLDGRYSDPRSLADMAVEIADLPWACSVPLVVDRALGSAGWVEKLDALALRYVTCVPSGELESCGAPIDWNVIDDLQNCDDNVSRLQEKAEAAGFEKINNDRYVYDLGIFKKKRPEISKVISRAQVAIGIAYETEGSSERMREIARRFNMSRREIYRYKELTSLIPKVRQRIENGEADGLGLSHLRKIAAEPAKRQIAVLDKMIKSSRYNFLQPPRSWRDKMPPILVHGVICFSPSRFIEDREADQQRLSRLQKYINKVNEKLASQSPKSLEDTQALAKVYKAVTKNRLGLVCSISMHKTKRTRKVVLHFDEEAWRHRRRSDGISLVISHPEVPDSAAELVTRFFSRNEIERDFRSIKSVIRLRPVHHQTDGKVRAHVTICVLALLLSRLIEKRLERAGTKLTISKLIEHLEPTRLGLLVNGSSRYTVTETTESVKKILAALKMEDLIDNKVITKHITPR